MLERVKSVELRKSGKSLPEALKGSRLLSKLQDLGVELDQLKRFIQVVKKISGNAGYQPQQVVDAAMRLSELEEESGRLYPEARKEFKSAIKRTRKLEEKELTLRSRVRGLNKELRTTASKLEVLDRRSEKAQKVLDRLGKTVGELARYRLKPDDFETVKAFLSEIRRLGREPTKAVEILKETSSLEDKQREEAEELRQLRKLNKEERRNQRQTIWQLEQEEETVRRRIDEKNKRLRQLADKESEETQKIQRLTNRRIAGEKQVDGLLQRQAAMLQVQPDIDLVTQALPAQKGELKQLEQQIEEKRTEIEVHKAFAAFLAKKPYKRNAVIALLQLAGHDPTYSSLDEYAHQRIVEVMAEQGFVPTETVEEEKKKAEKEIKACKEENRTCRSIAKKRLEDLRACEERHKHEQQAKAKKRDEAVDRSVANLIAKVL